MIPPVKNRFYGFNILWHLQNQHNLISFLTYKILQTVATPRFVLIQNTTNDFHYFEFNYKSKGNPWRLFYSDKLYLKSLVSGTEYRSMLTVHDTSSQASPKYSNIAVVIRIRIKGSKCCSRRKGTHWTGKAPRAERNKGNTPVYRQI